MRRLCNRVVWLEAGSIRQIGGTADVVSAYENALSTLRLESEARGDDATAARFVSWEVVEPRGESAHSIAADGPVTIRVRVRVRVPGCA